MNYSELANKMGISRKTVNDWIKERSKIPKKRLPQLSEIFDIPEDYFNNELDSLDKSKIEEIFARRKLESDPDDVHLQFKHELAKSDKEVQFKLKNIQRTILEILKLNYLKDLKMVEELLLSASNGEYEEDLDENVEDTATQIFFNRIERYLELLNLDNKEILNLIDQLMFTDTKN